MRVQCFLILPTALGELFYSEGLHFSSFWGLQWKTLDVPTAENVLANVTILSAVDAPTGAPSINLDLIGESAVMTLRAAFETNNKMIYVADIFDSITYQRVMGSFVRMIVLLLDHE